ncbi:uncharacterized protein DUF1573 [Flavobacteriaceae bacterium MAR_2009_75]|nr:uncharacterized protein DUF1573 [Flavobacteriaceae bacterium MAR_2009_75]
MALKPTLVLLLLSVIYFSSCSKSEESSDTQVTPPEVKEPERTAIVNLNTEIADSLNFGNVVKNYSKTIVFNFSNSGNSDLTISKLTLPDTFNTDFTSAILKPNDSTTISVNFNPLEIAEYNGFLEIESDATNVVGPIAITGKGVSDVYDGSISLLNQSEVDEFSASGYTKITGVLFIGNLVGNSSSISSLEKLSILTEIGSLDVANTTQLTNLSGLEDIIINQSISIGRNSKLENLNALSHLTRVENFVNIFGNPLLNDLNGLSNITEIGNDLWIRENNSLTSLEAFSKLTLVFDSFRLVNNIAIESLDGLENLRTQKGSFTVMNNQKLYNYCAIKNLLSSETFTGSFSSTRWNRYNPTRSLILGQDCSKEIPLDTYHGSLNLESDNGIEQFASKGYTKFDGTLSINGSRDLGQITTLEPLSNLVSISQELTIYDTDLTSLNGLEKITLLKNFTARNNETLVDYCAISTLAQNEGITFYISENNIFNPTIDNLKDGNCAQ